MTEPTLREPVTLERAIQLVEYLPTGHFVDCSESDGDRLARYQSAFNLIQGYGPKERKLTSFKWHNESGQEITRLMMIDFNDESPVKVRRRGRPPEAVLSHTGKEFKTSYFTIHSTYGIRERMGNNLQFMPAGDFFRIETAKLEHNRILSLLQYVNNANTESFRVRLAYRTYWIDGVSWTYFFIASKRPRRFGKKAA